MGKSVPYPAPCEVGASLDRGRREVGERSAPRSP